MTGDTDADEVLVDATVPGPATLSKASRIPQKEPGRGESKWES